MSELKINDLFYWVFGITQDDNEENKYKACAHKAYLDLCRTIKYKYSSSKIESYKKSKQKESDVELFLTAKDSLINGVETKIIDAEKSYNDEETSFDDWHENLTKSVQDLCKEKLSIFNKDSINSSGLTVGQIQKWINMSLKYLKTMGLMDDIPDKDMHIPLDDYILKAAEITGVIFESYEVKGLGIIKKEYNIKSWSELDDYDSYLEFQKIIKDTTNGCQVDWERNAWIAAAKKEKSHLER